MAEDAPREDTTESSWYGWGMNLISSVKQKSEEVVTLYKNELTEFGNTLVKDTSDAIDQEINNPNGVASKIKSAMSESFEKISSTVNALGEVGSDVDVPGGDELFDSWRRTFNLNDHKDEIGRLLESNDALRATLRDSVTEAMTEEDFWSRYFWGLRKRTERRLKKLEEQKHSDAEDEQLAEQIEVVTERPSNEEELTFIVSPKEYEGETTDVGDRAEHTKDISEKEVEKPPKAKIVEAKEDNQALPYDLLEDGDTEEWTEVRARDSVPALEVNVSEVKLDDVAAKLDDVQTTMTELTEKGGAHEWIELLPQSASTAHATCINEVGEAKDDDDDDDWLNWS